MLLLLVADVLKQAATKGDVGLQGMVAGRCWPRLSPPGPQQGLKLLIGHQESGSKPSPPQAGGLIPGCNLRRPGLKVRPDQMAQRLDLGLCIGLRAEI